MHGLSLVAEPLPRQPVERSCDSGEKRWFARTHVVGDRPSSRSAPSPPPGVVTSNQPS